MAERELPKLEMGVRFPSSALDHPVARDPLRRPCYGRDAGNPRARQIGSGILVTNSAAALR